MLRHHFLLGELIANRFCSSSEKRRIPRTVQSRNVFGIAVGVRIGFVAGQSPKGMAQRRDVAAVGIKEAEHVVEGEVLQHQYDEVFDLRQVDVAHRFLLVVSWWFMPSGSRGAVAGRASSGRRRQLGRTGRFELVCGVRKE